VSGFRHQQIEDGGFWKSEVGMGRIKIIKIESIPPTFIYLTQVLPLPTDKILKILIFFVAMGSGIAEILQFIEIINFI
jgi:hypothetical protein